MVGPHHSDPKTVRASDIASLILTFDRCPQVPHPPAEIFTIFHPVFCGKDRFIGISIADLPHYLMKLRTLSTFSALIAATFGMAVMSARADSFTLNYTFGGAAASGGAGTTIVATFDGTLNGNLITGISNATLTMNGLSFGSAYGYGIVGTSNPLWTNGAAVLSLDGTQNNFGFFNTNTPVLNSYTSYLLSLTGAAATQYNGGDSGIYAVNSLGLSINAYDQADPGTGTGLNASYKVTNLSNPSVPDNGTTLVMLGMAIAGMIGLRRKLKSAHSA
jgi:hypothetical protein